MAQVVPISMVRVVRPSRVREALLSLVRVVRLYSAQEVHLSLVRVVRPWKGRKVLLLVVRLYSAQEALIWMVQEALLLSLGHLEVGLIWMVRVAPILRGQAAHFAMVQEVLIWMVQAVLSEIVRSLLPLPLRRLRHSVGTLGRIL